MRSLDLARDENTFGFAGMTHSKNQSGSRSIVVIPSRTCEESHPRQLLPMFAGMRSLDLARDDNTSGMRSLDLARDDDTSGMRSLDLARDDDTSGMRSLDLARDDDTSGMRSLDLARDENTFGFAGMTHSNNQSGSRSIVVIPSRTGEESHPRQSLPMCAGMRSLGVARMPV
jgi:hypothetical protein